MRTPEPGKLGDAARLFKILKRRPYCTPDSDTVGYLRGTVTARPPCSEYPATSESECHQSAPFTTCQPNPPGHVLKNKPEQNLQ